MDPSDVAQRLQSLGLVELAGYKGGRIRLHGGLIRRYGAHRRSTEVSPFMHDSAQVDDEIELGGPIGGHFNWGPEDGGPVLFIGGGSGVVPFISMLRYRAALRSQVPVTLVFSARMRGDLLFSDELSSLAGAGDGFSLVVALTREAAAHPFRAGRIDDDFIAGILAGMRMPVRQVLICGSNSFVETAAEGTVATGMDPALIKTERYGV